jgi:hypothetical protein
MHVCKNDVKKKAAESSENEPPVSIRFWLYYER